jgi:hypothetical protein
MTRANPWLDMPFADYEGHMSLPTVGQAAMLADEFEAALRAHRPTEVAVIGCAAGNGFDRAAAAGVTRLVGLDINPGFLAEAERRHRGAFAVLELHCVDLEGEPPAIPPVELAYAALVFEHVDPKAALKNVSALCRPGAALVALLQLPSDALATVSPSPFASVQRVASIVRLVPPLELRTAAETQGFGFESAREFALPSGKGFSVQTFRFLGAP